MHVTVTFDKKLPLVGVNENGQETLFDASLDFSGPARHASPMDVVLEALAACSLMDILTILKKQKKDPVRIDVELTAERAAEPPRVFTSIGILYRLHGDGSSLDSFRKAIALSIDKYCSVAAMLKAGGVEITWEAELQAGAS